MRWLKLFFVIFLSVFLFFDEEPMFDITDWNIFHIISLAIAILSIISDNFYKAKFGQFVHKDLVLLFSTFSYWFFFENYILLIITVFCFHCLVPLEIELFELIDIHNALLVWAQTSLLNILLPVFLISFLIKILKYSINWNSSRLLYACIFSITVLIFINTILFLWDLLFCSLTGILFWANIKQYYIQSKTSLTYDNVLFATDQFDWHREQANHFVMRFEDLYTFLIQLIVISYSIVVLVVLIIFLIQLRKQKTSYSRLSSLNLSILSTWVKMYTYNILYTYIPLFIVSTRVLLKHLLEMWDYIIFICSL